MKFQVWDGANVDEEDAVTVDAIDAGCAAEMGAEQMDDDSGSEMFTWERGDPEVEVFVRDADGALTRWVVCAEARKVYAATPRKDFRREE